MSFYTSLTGLNSATKQLAVTSNNIANVGTSGFKRSRADFGDIFSTSPLQKSSAAIGQGVSLKQVSQEFSQGNVSTSGNSLDLAITGDGFFPLKSPDGLQDIYTRNGAFSLNDQNNVVNSTGQRLQAASVDSSGKADLSNLSALTIPPKTSGEAKETKAISLGLNLPAESNVITEAFDRADPSTYNKSTALTVYDSGGNGYLATVYYVKTQNASQSSPESKWQTYFYVGDTLVKPDLQQARAADNSLYYVNKYGEVHSASETDSKGIKIVTPPSGKTEMYTLDELTDERTSLPASVVGGGVGAIEDNSLYDAAEGGLKIASGAITFDMNVDGMNVDSGSVDANGDIIWDAQTVAISYPAADEVYSSYEELASHLEIQINNTLGALATSGEFGSNARYGVSVSFDADSGTFTIASGTTGDASSIEITGASAGAIAALGFDTDNNTYETTASLTEAVRGQESQPAVLVGESMTINTANEVSVTSSNNTFYVSVDGIAGNITIPAGSMTMESLAAKLQTEINLMKDTAGRQTFGVKVEFDPTNKKLSFTSATTGELATLQVSGHGDWGLDNTDIQFGTTSKWIKLAQHTENGALQYVKNGEQLEDGAELATGTEWWPVFLDRGELSFDLTGKLAIQVAVDGVKKSIPMLDDMPYETAFLDGGKGALNLSIDFTASTQYSSPFAVMSQSQDGAPEGELMGLDIGVDGLVSATYSNGSQNSLGKIVLANFSSPTGLRQVGDASYLASATSGTAKIGEAGSAGYGSIRAGATERSNVDLTQELVDLITAQRNFQANSKAIETSSTMTQAIINIRS